MPCPGRHRPATGNRIATFNAEASPLARALCGLVEIAHRIVDPADVVAESPAALPVDALRFLYPSRYCQADLVQQRAWDLFGHACRAAMRRCVAVRDWVRDEHQVPRRHVAQRHDGGLTRCARVRAYAAISRIR